MLFLQIFFIKFSNFGGLWEVGMKGGKIYLKRITGNGLFTFEQSYTVLTHVEVIMLSDQNVLLFCLRPAHFLIGRQDTAVPQVSVTI